MEIYWQEIIIGGFVLAASAYLFFSVFKKQPKGGCRSCPVAQPGRSLGRRNPNSK